jgi:hypothetical protein
MNTTRKIIKIEKKLTHRVHGPSAYDHNRTRCRILSRQDRVYRRIVLVPYNYCYRNDIDSI